LQGKQNQEAITALSRALDLYKQQDLTEGTKSRSRKGIAAVISRVGVLLVPQNIF